MRLRYRACLGPSRKQRRYRLVERGPDGGDGVPTGHPVVAAGGEEIACDGHPHGDPASGKRFDRIVAVTTLARGRVSAMPGPFCPTWPKPGLVRRIGRTRCRASRPPLQ